MKAGRGGEHQAGSWMMAYASSTMLKAGTSSVEPVTMPRIIRLCPRRSIVSLQ
jgi:hypothetical protein